MLRNRFRKFIGLLIVAVFGVVVYRYAGQTSGSEHVAVALMSGLKFLLFLALILWVVYLADRRLKKRED